jgi:tRNA U34 5-carboxymethylaminomethyl modifying GTPase MnmE/TrmE
LAITKSSFVNEGTFCYTSSLIQPGRAAPQFGRKAELDGFQRKAARRVEARDGQNQIGPPPSCLTKPLLKKNKYTDLQHISNHEIESEGIARSYELIENADITLLIIPASEDLTEEDIFLISTINKKNKECLYVLNKIDLQQQVDSKRISEISGIASEKILKISVKKNIGINQLKNRIKQLITDNQAGLDTEKTVICNVRHKNLLDKALESVKTAKDACVKKASEEFITFDVSKALNSLDEITGQSYSDEVLDKIFNEFCIGK